MRQIDLIQSTDRTETKNRNYHGVTVEKAEGLLIREERSLKILDLPGAFSLGGNSEDRQITSRVLIGHREEDKILFVMDASLAERSLQFLLQILELNVPVLVAVTMKDVLEKKEYVWNWIPSPKSSESYFNS